MGKKSQTVKQVNQPPSYIQQAQQTAIGQAQGLAQNPLQQYGGPQTAGFTPAQMQAFGTVNGAQGMANPYINLGAQYTANAANSIADQTPLLGMGATSGLAGTAYNTFTQGPSDILGVGAGAAPGLTNAVNQSTLGYMNPYTQQVVNATLAQMNNQDQQQQNQLVGNAVSAGAWGGDRAGVAQGVLGGQQALAKDQTIANILSQGYGQAQQTALGTVGQGINAAAQQNQFGLQYGSAAQQAYLAQLQAAQQAASQQGLLNLYAGQQFGGLGTEALQNTLAGANAQYGMGAQQQNLAQQQLNVPLGMFQQQQAYPYQQLQFLNSMINGTNFGGTQTSQQPAGSLFGQLAGAGLGLAGTGAFGPTGWMTGAGGLFGGSGATTLGAMSGSSLADLIPTILAAAKRGGAIGMADGGSTDDTLEFLNTRKLFGNPLFAAGGTAPTSMSPGKGFDGVATDVGIMRTPSGPQMGPVPMLGNTPPSLGLDTSPISNFTPQPNAYAPITTPSQLSGLNAPLPKVNNHSTRNMWQDIGMGLLGGVGAVFGLDRGGHVPGYDDGGDVYADYRQREQANALGLPVGGGLPSPMDTVSGLFHNITLGPDNPAHVPPQPVNNPTLRMNFASDPRVTPRMAAPPSPRPLGSPAPLPMTMEHGDLLTPWQGGSDMPMAAPVGASRSTGPHNVPIQQGQTRHLGMGTDITVQPDTIDSPSATAAASLGQQTPQVNQDGASEGSGFGPEGWNMPLVAMGLGMMGSRGNLGQAISQGGMDALNVMGQQHQMAFEQHKQAAEEKYREEEVQTAAKRMDVELEHYHEMYGAAEDRISEQRDWHQLMGSIDQGKAAAYEDLAHARAYNLQHGIPNKPITWNEAQSLAQKQYRLAYPPTNGQPWQDPDTGKPAPDANVWVPSVAAKLMHDDPYAGNAQPQPGGQGAAPPSTGHTATQSVKGLSPGQKGTPPPAPRDPAQRGINEIYMTPKGPLKWNGGTWETPQ